MIKFMDNAIVISATFILLVFFIGFIFSKNRKEHLTSQNPQLVSVDIVNKVDHLQKSVNQLQKTVSSLKKQVALNTKGVADYKKVKADFIKNT